LHEFTYANVNRGLGEITRATILISEKIGALIEPVPALAASIARERERLSTLIENKERPPEVR
jgi:hypothetical protein